MENETAMTLNVLGTEYRIFERSKNEDEMLKDNSGYCDKTTKTIVIAKKDSDCTLEDWNVYKRHCLRHEIIHAFMFESGLDSIDSYPLEMMVDWTAMQFPKIQEAFKIAECAR